MNTTDIMKDPFYAPILFEVEHRILACARAAKADGSDMNDSQIRCDTRERDLVELPRFAKGRGLILLYDRQAASMGSVLENEH
jgi:hypothetical protein